jgi:hypothetical protein
MVPVPKPRNADRARHAPQPIDPITPETTPPPTNPATGLTVSPSASAVLRLAIVANGLTEQAPDVL